MLSSVTAWGDLGPYTQPSIASESCRSSSQRPSEDSSVTTGAGTDLGRSKFSTEDATLDRLVGPRRRCIDGSLDRQQTVADYVPFDRGQNHNSDRILLVRHRLVSSEEDFEAAILGSSQKLAIFQS